MEIRYLGHASFRIKGKTGKVVIDPFDSSFVGLKFPSTDADCVLISHDHGDHNNAKAVGGNSVVLNGPGEYEVSGIKIYGYQTFHDKEKGAKRGKNTIYRILVDGVKVLHLGDLGEKLSDPALDELGDIDILMIPVGGTYTIDYKEAMEVVRQVEPRIVIPMHYRVEGANESFKSLSPISDFVKETGKTAQTMPKLTITSDQLPNELTLVVMSS